MNAENSIVLHRPFRETESSRPQGVDDRDGVLARLLADREDDGRLAVDARGRLGLFFAVDLVKNRATREPFNSMRDKVEGKPLVVEQIAAKMMGDGVAQQAWVSHFVIAPPLIVTKEELDLGIDTLDRHLSIADALVE